MPNGTKSSAPEPERLLFTGEDGLPPERRYVTLHRLAEADTWSSNRDRANPTVKRAGHANPALSEKPSALTESSCPPSQYEDRIFAPM